MMPTVAETLKDPKFYGLPADQQKIVLKRLDPNFGALPDGEQDKVLSRAKLKMQPPPESHGDIRPLTQRERFTMTYPVGVKGEGVGENLHNMAQNAGVGIFQTADAIAHPLRTGKAILDSLNPNSDAPNPLRATYEGLNTRPGETISNAAGQAIATAGAGEAAGAVVNGARRVIPAALRKGTEILTNTTPKVTAELAKGTAEDNAASAAAATEKNAAMAAKRSTQVKTHFDKTQAAKQAHTDASEAATRKEGLARGVEHLDPEIKAGLEKTEDTVNAEANRQYNELNAALDGKEAPRNLLPSMLETAADKIKGSNTEPTILKDMEKRMNGSDPLNYRDLQGYRSELGRELRKGALPGDVYHAYKGLQDEITDAMEQIAKDNGMEPQFKAARDYYRRYAEAFLDRGSPIRKALDTAEPSARYKSLSGRMTRNGKDVNALEVVAEYDPELAKRIGTVRGYQAESKAIRPPTSGAKQPPPLPPKPNPVVPETKTLSMEDISGAKGESLAKRAEAIRNKGGGWANTFVILDGIRNAIHGNIGGIGTDIAVRGTFGVGKAAIANLLEKPGVVKFLTAPTPRDIAQIPVGMRGDLRMVVEQAQQKGIKVNPSLLLVVGASGIASPRQ